MPEHDVARAQGASGEPNSETETAEAADEQVAKPKGRHAAPPIEDDDVKERTENGEPDRDQDQRKKQMNELLKKKIPTLPVLSSKKQTERQGDDKIRLWELILDISRFTNYLSRRVRIFFSAEIRLQTVNQRGGVWVKPNYTPMYIVEKAQTQALDRPFIFFQRKAFKMSYNELDRHMLKVDMWEVSSWTFNKYVGVRCQPLSDIFNKDPDRQFLLRKKLSREQTKAKVKATDVATVSCHVNLEEIFDFDLHYDNWSMVLSESHEDKKKFARSQKRLTFVVPKNRKGKALNTVGGHCVRTTTEWDMENTYTWLGIPKFKFTGTRMDLRNAFFVVLVHSGSGYSCITAAPFALGRCLFNLVSVLENSRFKGAVKMLAAGNRFVVGELTGNVKCVERSKNFTDQDCELSHPRPGQPISTSTVSHLTKERQYLVVKVKKCVNLPVADVSTNASDPCVRATWDNMVLRSMTRKGTLRPLFDFSFFFPVRVVFPEVLYKKKYFDNILKQELEQKGNIQLDVWHESISSPDLLGSTEITLNDILKVKRKVQRDMQGPPKSEKESEQDGDEADEEVIEDVAEQKVEWYSEIVDTRVFSGTKVALMHSELPSTQEPSIFFEAYFYPDFDESLQELLLARVGEDAQSGLLAKKDKFDSENKKLQERYVQSFPDCQLRALRNSETEPSLFPCVYRHRQRRTYVPLTCLLSPVLVPDEYSMPAQLMHWASSVCFETSARQCKEGIISPKDWQEPSITLSKRKGSVQDHAIVLCSLLLGCQRDAFVCKGTVLTDDGGSQQRSMDHVWVMTRSKGWVTFWEPCTRQMFHMPKRHRCTAKRRDRPSSKKKPLSKTDDAVAPSKLAEKEKDVDDDEADNAETYGYRPGQIGSWEGEVNDNRLELEDLDRLPTVGRQPKAKQRVAGKSNRDAKGREAALEKMLLAREKLPFAPNPEMTTEKTTVNFLPYDSIECVFNTRNIWANHQNHHPACITYDMEEEESSSAASTEGKVASTRKWLPFFSDDDTDLGDEYRDTNVSLKPAFRQEDVEYLRRQLHTEIEENVKLHRAKLGFDIMWDQTPFLLSQLERFLDIQELRLQLDMDFVPKADLVTKEGGADAKDYIRETMDIRCWNVHGSPFNKDKLFSSYEEEQVKKWKKLVKLVEDFRNDRHSFPVHRGRRFEGFPVHFNTSNVELVRSYLCEMKQYHEYLDRKDDNLHYTLVCKIYPLLGQVLSVWLYLGIRVPKSEKDA